MALATMELAMSEGESDIDSSDDDPTIKMPAPILPAGLPSPLGDDDDAPLSDTLTMTRLQTAPASLDDNARRAVIASWTLAIATAGVCAYLLAVT